MRVMKITDMHIMLDRKEIAGFSCVLGEVKTYNWKLYKSHEGIYSIEPPYIKYTDKLTGEPKKNYVVSVLPELQKAITSRAVNTYFNKVKQVQTKLKDLYN